MCACGTIRRVAFVASVLGIALLLPRPSVAQVQVSAASDLTPWLANGHSVALMAEGKMLGNWRLTAEQWSMEFPEFLTELSAANAGKGFKQQVAQAWALYADRHVNPSGDGWHVGGVVNFMASTISRKAHGQTARLHVLELLARGGYRWFAFRDHGLFINPWVGVGLPIVLQAATAIGDATFVQPPVQLLATVHVGWRFGQQNTH